MLQDDTRQTSMLRVHDVQLSYRPSPLLTHCGKPTSLLFIKHALINYDPETVATASSCNNKSVIHDADAIVQRPLNYNSLTVLPHTLIY